MQKRLHICLLVSAPVAVCCALECYTHIIIFSSDLVAKNNSWNNTTSVFLFETNPFAWLLKYIRIESSKSNSLRYYTVLYCTVLYRAVEKRYLASDNLLCSLFIAISFSSDYPVQIKRVSDTMESEFLKILPEISSPNLKQMQDSYATMNHKTRCVWLIKKKIAKNLMKHGL